MEFSFLHTCIRVFDLEKSVEFYKKALGLEVIATKDNKEAEFTLVYLADKGRNHELELTYNYGKEQPYDLGNGYSHICFKVDDVEKAHAYHKENGVECTDLKKPTGTNFVYFITDPDGYKIEIM